MRGKPFDVELFSAAVLTYQAHIQVDAQHDLESANTLRGPEL